MREQRLLKHFERQARHESADIGHGPVAPSAHALNRRPPNPVDGRRKFRGLTGRKQGRERAPLDAPVLALGGQEPVAESRPQDAKLKVVFAVINGIVEKDASHGRWIMRRAAKAENGLPDGNRPFEIALPPDFDRIALEGKESRERSARPLRAGRVRGNEKPRGYWRGRHAIALERLGAQT